MWVLERNDVSIYDIDDRTVSNAAITSIEATVDEHSIGQSIGPYQNLANDIF